MRIRGKWLAIAAIATLAWCHHHGSSSRPDEASKASSIADDQVTQLVRQLPTPAQLKLHPRFVVGGELVLEGQAIDDHKQPVAGAVITLNGTRTVTTEADGAFAFDHLAAGDYHVTAMHDAMFGEEDPTLSDSSEPVEIKLESGVTMHVHVVDGTRPVRDANIRVNRHEAVSDVDGNATLRGLSLDSVRVNVSADGYGPQRIDTPTGDDVHTLIEVTVKLVHGTAFGGTVVDETGKLVPGATVEVKQGDWRDRVDVDEKGHWEVPFLAPGLVTVSGASPATISVPDQLVAHDRAQHDVVVHVTTGAKANGVVVDRGGTPIADASVNVGSGYGRTDEHGRFTIVGIEPGLVDVSANNEHAAAVTRKVQVELGRAAELRIELVDSSIAGIVRDSHGEPVADAVVQAKGVDDIGFGYTHTEDNGHFDTGGIPPGNYEIIVTRDGDRMSQPEHGPMVKSGNRDVRIVLPELGSVTGRVVAAGSPVPYYGIAITEDMTPDATASPDPIRVADGRFELRDVRPGTYQLLVVGPGFTRKAMQVRVAEDAATDVGDITVDRGRIVHGTVRDETGRGVANALVVAASSQFRLDETSLDAQMRGAINAHTDATGAFELAGVGTDEVYIQAQLDRLMSAPQTLAPEDVEKDLVISRVGSIEGHVANARSERFRYYIHGVEGNNVVFVDDAEPDGSFHQDRVPPGDYTIESMFDKVVVPPQQFHVDADTTAVVTIELSPTPIVLEVRSDSCKDIWLKSTMGAYLLNKDCANGVATFEDIAVNSYRVCDNDFDRCADVTVTASPSRQTILIPSQAPPEPTDPEPPAADEPEETPDP